MVSLSSGEKIKLFYFSTLTIYQTRHALNTVFICLSIMFSLCSWNQIWSLFSYQKNHQLGLIDGMIFSYLNLNHFDQIDQVAPRHEYFWGHIKCITGFSGLLRLYLSEFIGVHILHLTTISKGCKKMYLVQKKWFVLIALIRCRQCAHILMLISP